MVREESSPTAGAATAEVPKTILYRVQQFQMNRYILQGFLKWLFWYILNLYGKLPLLVKKFLQKDQFKGPKKEKKNVDFATFLKSPHFLQMNR